MTRMASYIGVTPSQLVAFNFRINKIRVINVDRLSANKSILEGSINSSGLTDWASKQFRSCCDSYRDKMHLTNTRASSLAAGSHVAVWTTNYQIDHFVESLTSPFTTGLLQPRKIAVIIRHYLLVQCQAQSCVCVCVACIQYCRTAILWNSLSLQVRNTETITTFRTRLKCNL